MTGYLNAAYAASFDEVGVPRWLPNCDGWILKRQVPGTSLQDAMGCYPVFCCRDWHRLSDDLTELETQRELVCLSLVTDPFGDFDERSLRGWFPHRSMAYKEHFVRDLSLPVDRFLPENHIRNAARGLKSLTLELCQPPHNHADEWIALYRNLTSRHSITGFAAFSDRTLAAQLSVPGIYAWRALYRDRAVGMVLWYRCGDVAYYHLAAFSDEGYEQRASFALFITAIESFASMGVRRLGLGAGSGVAGACEDGLTRFKRGWSSGTRTVYFCGRIYDSAAYEALRRSRGSADSSLFPAYRAAEFV